MLRVVFMGTPGFAVPTLAAIISGGYAVVAVYSQPARPAGRGIPQSRSAVQSFAEASGLAVQTPRSLSNEPVQTAFRRHQADVAIVVAYGLLLPRPILDAPRLGCLNLHASLLPRWRGAAPIQRSIMAGDTETAATIMRMEEGLDTGPICLAERVAIGADTTAGELHDRLADLGASLMLRALAALERNSLDATPQRADGVTYATKIDKSEARIDFARPAAEVHNRIRGLSPFPGAWFEAEVDGRRERIKVLRSIRIERPKEGAVPPGTVLDAELTIACGSDAVRLTEVQRAGKRPLSAAEFLRGFALPPGNRLASGAATK